MSSNVIINERSEVYFLRNLETGNCLDRRLLSPNEAADANHYLRQTNQRWVPFSSPTSYELAEQLAKFHAVNA